MSDQSNPYAPPSAPVAAVQTVSPRSIRLKALLCGVAVDLLGKKIAFYLLGFLLAQAFAYRDNALLSILTSAMQGVGGLLIGLALGSFISALGAYVCARIAKQSEFALASIQALLLVGYATIMRGLTGTFTHYALFSLATLAAIFIGAAWGQHHNRQRPKEPIS